MRLQLPCPEGNRPVLWLRVLSFFPGAPKFRHERVVEFSDIPANRAEREILHQGKVCRCHPLSEGS